MNDSNPLRLIQAPRGDTAEAERLAAEAIDASAAAYRYELHGRDGVTTTGKLTPDSARLAERSSLASVPPAGVGLIGSAGTTTVADGSTQAQPSPSGARRRALLHPGAEAFPAGGLTTSGLGYPI